PLDLGVVLVEPNARAIQHHARERQFLLARGRLGIGGTRGARTGNCHDESERTSGHAATEKREQACHIDNLLRRCAGRASKYCSTLRKSTFSTRGVTRWFQEN